MARLLLLGLPCLLLVAIIYFSDAIMAVTEEWTSIVSTHAAALTVCVNMVLSSEVPFQFELRHVGKLQRGRSVSVRWVPQLPSSLMVYSKTTLTREIDELAGEIMPLVPSKTTVTAVSRVRFNLQTGQHKFTFEALDPGERDDCMAAIQRAIRRGDPNEGVENDGSNSSSGGNDEVDNNDGLHPEETAGNGGRASSAPANVDRASPSESTPATATATTAATTAAAPGGGNHIEHDPAGTTSSASKGTGLQAAAAAATGVEGATVDAPPGEEQAARPTMPDDNIAGGTPREPTLEAAAAANTTTTTTAAGGTAAQDLPISEEGAKRVPLGTGDGRAAGDAVFPADADGGGGNRGSSNNGGDVGGAGSDNGTRGEATTAPEPALRMVATINVRVGLLRRWQPRELSIYPDFTMKHCGMKNGEATTSCKWLELDHSSKIVVEQPNKSDQGGEFIFQVKGKGGKTWRLDAETFERRIQHSVFVHRVINRARAEHRDANFKKEETHRAENAGDVRFPPSNPWTTSTPGPAFRGPVLSPDDDPLLPWHFLSTLPLLDSANLEVTDSGDVIFRKGDLPAFPADDVPLWTHRAADGSAGGKDNAGGGLCSFKSWLGAPARLSVKNGQWRVGRGFWCTLGESPKPAGVWRTRLPWDARGKAMKSASLQIKEDHTLVLASGDTVYWSSSDDPRP